MKVHARHPLTRRDNDGCAALNHAAETTCDGGRRRKREEKGGANGRPTTTRTTAGEEKEKKYRRLAAAEAATDKNGESRRHPSRSHRFSFFPQRDPSSPHSRATRQSAKQAPSPPPSPATVRLRTINASLGPRWRCSPQACRLRVTYSAAKHYAHPRSLDRASGKKKPATPLCFTCCTSLVLRKRAHEATLGPRESTSSTLVGHRVQDRLRNNTR